MGSCCNKRETLSISTRRGSIPSRRSSILFEKFSKQWNYKKKYEYISMLGNGGFGKVRLYRDRVCKDMKYAIKTIKKDFFNPHGIESMINEVDILRNLDHPNIVKYFETYEDDYYLHIVMEYIPGDNLFKMITNRVYSNFGEKDSAEIMLYLMKTVLFLHYNKIIHRDIKPENILFSVPGQYSSLKVIDFGLSEIKAGKDKYRVGSPFYMAPEAISGTYSPETDTWSIGVILYVMTSGVQPFQGKEHNEVFEKIKKGTYSTKPLEKFKCSNDLKDLITKMLIYDPKNRITLQEALEHPWIKHFDSTDTHYPIDSDIIDSLKRFCSINTLEKEVLFYIAKISNENEIQKLKQAFAAIDTDNSGEIEYAEIPAIFEKLGIKSSDADLQNIWENLDFHKDGKINYSEFLAATISSVQFMKEEKLWSAFKYFDTNNSGYITFDSVIEALKASNVSFNENGLNEDFQKFKKMGKKINFEEFKQIFFKKLPSNSN